MNKKRLLTVMGGSKKIPWYLAGGIPISSCIAAYQAVGRNTYAETLINLVNSSIHILTDTGRTPDWNTTDGWIGASGDALTTDIKPYKNYTLAIRYKDVVDTDANESFSKIGVFNKYYFGLDHSGTDATALRFANGLDASKYRDIAPNSLEYGTAILAGRSCYVDGVYKNIIADSTWNSDGLQPSIRILNRDDYTAPLGGKILAWAIYNETLDAPTIAQLHTAMMALP